jgi:hypothetical protein
MKLRLLLYNLDHKKQNYFTYCNKVGSDANCLSYCNKLVGHSHPGIKYISLRKDSGLIKLSTSYCLPLGGIHSFGRRRQFDFSMCMSVGIFLLILNAIVLMIVITDKAIRGGLEEMKDL